MTYNFDQVIDRSTSHSEKWCFDLAPSSSRAPYQSPIPMWIADMDFETAPPISEALHRAVRHGTLGYSLVADSYKHSVVEWQRKRYRWEIQPDWLIQTAGVVAAVSQVVRTFTREGDSILIQPPVYARFQKLSVLNKRRVVTAPLIECETSYAFDPTAFEAVIRRERPRLFILCNPHNPVGKVWTLAELHAIGEICAHYEVLVVSDEIHADLIIDEHCEHIPFAKIESTFAQQCITCTSPSKAFNLAGLQVANVIVPNPNLRERLLREMQASGSSSVNTLGLVACEAAYRSGEPWLSELLVYLRENHRAFEGAISKSVPELRVFRSDALYLAWLDCRALALRDLALEDFMLNDAGVWLVSGASFGAGGEGFMRVNLACRRALLNDAIERIELGVRNLRAAAPRLL